MKTLFKFLAILTVLAFPFAPSLVRAQDAPPPPPDNQGSDQSGDQGASFQTFYDQLGDQGTWVQTDDYGYVFQPNVTDPNWAPYTDGHWVYTDAGWTWVSDEPWGWATYHYGRWANIDGTGWVWVPGYQWAPAWVSWRYGGGYCGWAPLPPETVVGIGIGFHFGGDVDVNFNIGPGCYNFVSVGDMGYPNYRGRYLDRSRNYVVINKTTNITNININRTTGAASNFRGVSVGGPTLNEVNAQSKQHIQTVQLAAANQPGRSTLNGNSLAVYAPRVNPTTAQQAKPARVSQTIAHPTFNRGDSITKPLDVTSSVKASAPSATAIEAARAAQAHIPAHAKIATEKTTVKPLTSLQPVTQSHPTPKATATGANGFNGASTVNSNAERSSANAPYTGESVKPAVTQPKEVNPKPATTYQPQTEVQPKTEKPAKTYQPQTEAQPTQTYHPQSQVQPQSEKPAKTYQPQTETQPTQTYHPQNEVQPKTEVQPTQTYHPQSQVQPQHEAPPTHTQSAPVNKPASTGNQGNKNTTDGQNKQQGQ